MTTEMAPAGWYPDPERPGGQRWWDGRQWTSHLHPAPPPQPAPQFAPPGAYVPAWPCAGRLPADPAPASFARRNRQSLTTIAVVAVYIVLAATSRIVVFGILPVVLSVRAVKLREQLAPLAVVAAVIAVVVALTSLR